MNNLELLRVAKEQGLLKGRLLLKDIIEITKIDIDQSTLSRILKAPTNTGSETRLLKALNDERINHKIAEKLGADSLLGPNGVEALLAEQEKNDHSTAPRIEFLQCELGSGPNLLCNEELHALDILRSEMTTNSLTPLKIWEAENWSGASFVARNLRYDQGPEGQISRIISLRHSSPKEPFTKELSVLTKHFGFEVTDVDFGPQLLERLHAEGAVLVFNGVNCLRDGILNKKRLPITKLVRASHAMSNNWDKPPVVLLVGKATGTGLSGRQVGRNINDQLMLSKKKRYPFFCGQLERFARLRGIFEPAEGGSRRKRARWHYESIKKQDVWPINVRLRAFFASNHDNYSYFDATAGFDKLAGDISFLPEDIASYVDDVHGYLADIDQIGEPGPSSRKTGRHLLRLMSSAIYWLNIDALNILQKGNQSPHVQALTDKSLKGALTVLEDAIKSQSLQRQTYPYDSVPAYAVGIGIKSIIQDDWKHNSPGARALVHHKIAKRLFDNQNVKTLLNLEFPYEPHWGRSRIFFLAETIRHLVRSCEAVQPFTTEQDAIYEKLEFPSGPAQLLNGCDPYEVWPFCFDSIFQRELNGNKKPLASRSLAKRHGAYELTIEILQLLSSENEMGEPHWALPEHLHRDFRLETAFAFLDVGELRKAKKLFEKIVATGDRENIQQTIEDLLCLTLVDTLLGDVAAAAATLSASEELLKRFCAAEKMRILGDPRAGSKEKARSNRLIVRLERRIASRRAQFHILRGEFHQAVSIYDDLDRVSNRLRGEIAHGYIAARRALGKSASSKECADYHYEEAMTVCVKNINVCQGDGKNHEAMGFQIAMSGILRDAFGYNQAAEASLNEIYTNILRYGCSERTYLHFLIEAGLTMYRQGRYRRAYTAYLLPAISRASIKGHWLEAKNATIVARQAILKLLEQQKRMSIDEWRDDYEKSIEEENKFKKQDRPSLVGGFARDPLFGFQTGEGLFALKSTIDREYLTQQLAHLDSALENPLAKPPSSDEALS